MSNSNQPVSELEETLRPPTVDAVESSTDEEFYAFGDGGARADPLHLINRSIRVKARNTELYRTACNKTEPFTKRQRKETRMWREEMVQEGKDSQDCSQASSFLPANPRGCSHHQGDHSLFAQPNKPSTPTGNLFTQAGKPSKIFTERRKPFTQHKHSSRLFTLPSWRQNSPVTRNWRTEKSALSTSSPIWPTRSLQRKKFWTL